MPLYEYRCEDGHRTELVRPIGFDDESCWCGKPSKRGHVHRVISREPEVDLRGMYRRFNEASQEISAAGGDIGAVYRESKATAGEMVTRGETPTIRS